MTEKSVREQLLDAVEKLAQPYMERNIIVDDDPVHGTDKKVVASLRRDGLLKQLRTAVVGGIGSHDGSLPGRERIPFDTGALELYDSIERDITRKFVALVQKPVHLELERTLSQWRLAFDDAHAKGTVSVSQYESVKDSVCGWVEKIEAHFVKSKQLELTINIYARDVNGDIIRESDKSWRVAERLPAECPSCGEAIAFLPVTGFRVFALLFEYTEVGQDTLKTANVECRFCQASWSGLDGVRDLAYQLEQQEARRNEILEVV